MSVLRRFVCSNFPMISVDHSSVAVAPGSTNGIPRHFALLQHHKQCTKAMPQHGHSHAMSAHQKLESRSGKCASRTCPSVLGCHQLTCRMLARSRVRPHLVFVCLPRICSGFQPCQEITHRFAADVNQVAHLERVSISELSPLAPRNH